MKNSQYDFRAGTRRDEDDRLTHKLKIGFHSKINLISALSGAFFGPRPPTENAAALTKSANENLHKLSCKDKTRVLRGSFRNEMSIEESAQSRFPLSPLKNSPRRLVQKTQGRAKWSGNVPTAGGAHRGTRAARPYSQPAAAGGAQIETEHSKRFRSGSLR